MKKLVSILAAAALVFAMAVPAMAAESPEPNGQDVVSSASTVDGYHIVISEAEPSEAALAALPDAAAAAVGTTDVEYSTDCVDVNVTNDAGQVVNDQYFASNGALLVTFVRDNADTVLAVLYWNEATQAWDSASFTQDGNVIHAMLNHLCPVAFVVKTSDAAGSATDAEAEAGADAASIGGATSAQTGYESVVWLVLSITALAGAGICFKTSKKSAVSAA